MCDIISWPCLCCITVSGSTRVGQTEGVITTVLACILRVPQYVPVSERFDILVLVSNLTYYVNITFNSQGPSCSNLSHFWNVNFCNQQKM